MSSGQDVPQSSDDGDAAYGKFLEVFQQSQQQNLEMMSSLSRGFQATLDMH
jgi:hypothetical protein